MALIPMGVWCESVELVEYS